jgi:DNA-binding HxlR family transcriptional regulator
VVPFGEYCAFTKTLEHLGDRWSLLIVRNLAISGSQGFNALADGLPGISRSVLARRLHKLEELGLIARDPASRSRPAPFRLAPAGEQLMPTLMSLRLWAEHWVPEDPALALRDPDVILWWLIQRVDQEALPDHQVVMALDIRGFRVKQVWLVLEPGIAPSVCLHDPDLGLDRYVYVEGDAAGLLPISRGERNWTAAIDDGSIQIFGEPRLVRALPSWFLSVSDQRGVLAALT